MTASDLLDIGAKNSDLSDAISVVKDSDGSVRWLEPGDADTGFIHIRKKHITGEIPDGSKFPPTLSELEVKQLIFRTIKRGSKEAADDPRGGFVYEFTDSATGIETRVAVGENGYVLTGFPLNP